MPTVPAAARPVLTRIGVLGNLQGGEVDLGLQRRGKAMTQEIPGDLQPPEALPK
jgi:hypothetical protein